MMEGFLITNFESTLISSYFLPMMLWFFVDLMRAIWVF